MQEWRPDRSPLNQADIAQHAQALCDLRRCRVNAELLIDRLGDIVLGRHLDAAAFVCQIAQHPRCRGHDVGLPCQGIENDCGVIKTPQYQSAGQREIR